MTTSIAYQIITNKIEKGETLTIKQESGVNKVYHTVKHQEQKEQIRKINSFEAILQASKGLN